MQEYCDFADCFWIAVPEELEEDAKKIMIDGWGLLTFATSNIAKKVEEQKKAEIRVSIRAKKEPGIFRDKTIETALIKMI